MTNPYQPPIANLGGISGPLSGGEYEFGQRENQIIERTAKLARIWGVLALATGVLFLLLLLVTVALISAAIASARSTNSDEAVAMGMLITIFAIFFGPVAIVHLVTGWFYIRSGQSFREIVDSSGHDIDLLLMGLSKLTGAFKVEVIFVIISLVLSGVILIVANVMEVVQRTGG